MTLAALSLALATVQADTRPNVIVIVVDDVGYNDLSFTGNGDIPTPKVDRLASNGVVLTQGYVVSTVCAPSRAGLMTGKYPTRFGFEFNEGTSTSNIFGLPGGEQTLASRLKTQGYATGMFGKWHLGTVDGKVPNDRGFDYFYGFLAGHNNYLPRQEGSIYPFFENRTPIEIDKYFPTDMTDKALSYIGEHANDKFFMYLSYNNNHQPLEAPQKYLDRFPNMTGNRRIVAAMTSAVDDQIGRIARELRDRKLLNNTMIVFIDDNGGDSRLGSDNTPFRGRKGFVLEGGIRVPFFLSWPARIRSGRYDKPVASIDIVPTVLQATGSPAKWFDRIDGVNLIPYLKKANPLTSAPHEAIYWRQGRMNGVRYGNFKYIWGEWDKPKVPFEELYDVENDPSETTNLLRQLPNVKTFLLAKWNAWNAKNREPLWQPGG
ncbi:MAG TPA: sulfatase-like hydrolase/transferase [Fimbriimonas sp.]|nr:sulfatase-like hydrolase/transferase [Fimbriimonas sp.]